MKAKFLFASQYNIFNQDNQSYMVDMYYLSWLVTIFPPVCYFIKYPVYEIDQQDFIKMKEFTNQKKNNNKNNKGKTNYITLIAVMSFLTDILLGINIQTSTFIAFIITVTIVFITYFVFKKYFIKFQRDDYIKYAGYFPAYKKTSKKIIFKFNGQCFRNLVSVYIWQIFFFGCNLGLLRSFIYDGQINLFYSIIAGIAFVLIIKVSPIGCFKNLTAEMKE